MYKEAIRFGRFILLYIDSVRIKLQHIYVIWESTLIKLRMRIFS